MTVQELFKLGMKRDVESILEPGPGEVLNLGAGNTEYDWATPLDLPTWDAETMQIPRADESVSAIYAFHFLEHFHGKRTIEILRECERVLVPGGLLTVVVPHRLGAMAFQDLDHKCFWTEETWKTLLGNSYYDKHGEWKLSLRFNMIAGIAERNLCLMSQLVKDGER